VFFGGGTEKPLTGMVGGRVACTSDTATVLYYVKCNLIEINLVLLFFFCLFLYCCFCGLLYGDKKDNILDYHLTLASCHMLVCLGQL
jgi:hypothetical protein